MDVSANKGGRADSRGDAYVVGVDFGTLSARALLHDYFGRGTNEVMYRLRAIRDRAREGGSR
jgi:hypothetical protein